MVMKHEPFFSHEPNSVDNSERKASLVRSALFALPPLPPSIGVVEVEDDEVDTTVGTSIVEYHTHTLHPSPLLHTNDNLDSHSAAMNGGVVVVEPYLALSAPFVVPPTGGAGGGGAGVHVVVSKLGERIESLGGTQRSSSGGTQGWKCTLSLLYDKNAINIHSSYWFHVHCSHYNGPFLLHLQNLSPLLGWIPGPNNNNNNNTINSNPIVDAPTATSLRGVELVLATTGIDHLRTLAHVDGVSWSLGDDWTIHLGTIRNPKATAPQAVCGMITYEATRTRSPANMARFEEWRERLTSGLGFDMQLILADHHMNLNGLTEKTSQYSRDVFVQQWLQVVQLVFGREAMKRAVQDVQMSAHAEEATKQQQQGRRH